MHPETQQQAFMDLACCSQDLSNDPGNEYWHCCYDAPGSAYRVPQYAMTLRVPPPRARRNRKRAVRRSTSRNVAGSRGGARRGLQGRRPGNSARRPRRRPATCARLAPCRESVTSHARTALPTSSQPHSNAGRRRCPEFLSRRRSFAWPDGQFMSSRLCRVVLHWSLVDVLSPVALDRRDVDGHVLAPMFLVWTVRGGGSTRPRVDAREGT